MNKSKIKTWFKRNGFKPDGLNNSAFRKDWTYCHKGGRHFRVKFQKFNNVTVCTVDTSDLNFDRWANSCEIYAQDIYEFISYHMSIKEKS